MKPRKRKVRKPKPLTFGDATVELNPHNEMTVTITGHVNWEFIYNDQAKRLHAWLGKAIEFLEQEKGKKG